MSASEQNAWETMVSWNVISDPVAKYDREKKRREQSALVEMSGLRIERERARLLKLRELREATCES